MAPPPGGMRDRQPPAKGAATQTSARLDADGGSLRLGAHLPGRLFHAAPLGGKETRPKLHPNSIPFH